jgi:hypothetical protein
MTMKPTARLAFFFLLLFSSSLPANKIFWNRDDSFFNPSGVPFESPTLSDCGDIDGDGFPDLVCSSGSAVHFYRNTGSASQISFERRVDWENTVFCGPSFTLGYTTTLADLNRDGRCELILADSKNSLFRVRRLDTGGWSICDSLLKGLAPTPRYAFGDVDADGDLDHVFTATDHAYPACCLSVNYNTHTPQKPAWRCVETRIRMYDSYGPGLDYFRLFDLDTDGKQDLLVTGSWMAYAGIGFRKNISSSDSLKMIDERITISEGNGVMASIADLNHDGSPEIITSNRYYYSILAETTHLVFQKIADWGAPRGNPYIFYKARSSIAHAACDLNGDSRMDLLYAHNKAPTDYWDGIIELHSFIRQNNALGFLEKTEWSSYDNDFTYGYSSSPAFHMTDWENDGQRDLVWSSKKYVLNDQTGYFTLQGHCIGLLKETKGGESVWSFENSIFERFKDDTSYFDPVIEDMDGDGRYELFVQQSGAYKFMRNSGADALSPEWTDMDAAWSAGLNGKPHYRACIVDLRQDGKKDVLFSDTDGTLILFDNTGSPVAPVWKADTAVFRDVELDSFPVPSFSDMDGDGDIDMLVSDRNGNINFYRNDTTLASGLASASGPVKTFRISAYPNPFNLESTICFSLNSPGRVRLDVFNATGQRIATLAEQYFNRGEYRIRWNGKSGNGAALASGLYFFRIKIADQSKTVKLMMVK